MQIENGVRLRGYQARAQHVFVAGRQRKMLAVLIHEETYPILIQISEKQIHWLIDALYEVIPI